MMTGGMGGSGAGGGGAGGGGAGGAGGSTVAGCEAAMTGTPAELHAAALMALRASCGSSGSCHDGDRGNQGMLGILEGANLNTLLVKAACQAPAMKLVSSDSGNAALDASYLWQKITAPVDRSMLLIAKPEWGASATCGQPTGFGERMPWGGLPFPESRLTAVRNWICAGAPGP